MVSQKKSLISGTRSGSGFFDYVAGFAVGLFCFVILSFISQMILLAPKYTWIIVIVVHLAIFLFFVRTAYKTFALGLLLFPLLYILYVLLVIQDFRFFY